MPMPAGQLLPPRPRSKGEEPLPSGDLSVSTSAGGQLSESILIRSGRRKQQMAVAVFLGTLYLLQHLPSGQPLLCTSRTLSLKNPEETKGKATN